MGSGGCPRGGGCYRWAVGWKAGQARQATSQHASSAASLPSPELKRVSNMAPEVTAALRNMVTSRAWGGGRRGHGRR